MESHPHRAEPHEKTTAVLQHVDSGAFAQAREQKARSSLISAEIREPTIGSAQ
jgi:hypothetical protein